MDAIRAVVRAVAPKPVNVVVGPRTGPVSLDELAAAGVRRVSLGGALYRGAMTGLVQAAEALRRGDIATGARGIPSGEIAALLPP
jgi:2-methylisocitrate lyase-like PEP mutase family enzyme